MEQNDADSPDARAIAVTLGKRLHLERRLAAELDAIADQLALLFTVRLDDPMDQWHPDTREEFRKRGLSRIVEDLRAVARTLMPPPTSPAP